LLEHRLRDYATLLSTIANDNAKRLEEVRLPLHILLENHFGDLNENQEEMLGAARAAAEAADADLVSLRQIAELDLGDHPLRRDRMKPSELLDALRPMLVAAAESVGATIEINVAPLLPAIIGDRARLQDALATTLGDAIRSADAGVRLHLAVDRHDGDIRAELAGHFGDSSSVRLAAAERIIHAHGGAIGRHPDALTLDLPFETNARAAAS
jgi:signal transduction histidine kinase